MWLNWENLPKPLQTPEVRPYYDALAKHRLSLFCKRVLDFCLACVLVLFLSPFILLISLWIKLTSRGPVFFRQERATAYGKVFRIFKFRTMVVGAEQKGSQITVSKDARVTRAGAFLRRYKLDEIPQLFNVLTGDMSFVGTRPEVLKYVQQYKPVYRATLLTAAGITSQASIRYKDESTLIENAADVDKVYLEQVLPEKMKYNLAAIENFSLWADIQTMFQTVFSMGDNK